MAQVTECIEGYYEVQDVEFGRYETDYAATIREKLPGKQLREEALHPWRLLINVLCMASRPPTPFSWTP